MGDGSLLVGSFGALVSTLSSPLQLGLRSRGGPDRLLAWSLFLPPFLASPSGHLRGTVEEGRHLGTDSYPLCGGVQLLATICNGCKFAMVAIVLAFHVLCCAVICNGCKCA